MRFEEYRKHDAISLAGLIAKRQVSAKEVLETAIARADALKETTPTQGADEVFGDAHRINLPSRA
jgi:Asp-tRNA(Asn)/Glu-tRNA(Gln) amidotransferase A subunit family amidase